MSQPYTHLRAQLSPAAQAEAEARARTILQDDGWAPWPLHATDMRDTPYAYRQVEMIREDWDAPQCVDPRLLDPMTHAAGLWWRPVVERP